ncbi:MAG: MBL fold metallo-hydrolase [Deltaproteobacteria bacterium]|nr:MBL fold metallo-hydrolase [Deltaproteobacteria bacterium]
MKTEKPRGGEPAGDARPEGRPAVPPEGKRRAPVGATPPGGPGDRPRRSPPEAEEPRDASGTEGSAADAEEAGRPAGRRALPPESGKTRKTWKGRLPRMMLLTAVGFVSLAVLLFAGGCFYLKSERFGALPEGERLARIERSPNWRDGEFRNLQPARDTSAEGRHGLLGFFFRGGRTAPRGPLPVAVTDLKNLKDGEFVWFGHSTFLFVLGGRTFLVDPVFIGSISPIPFAVKTYGGTHAYGIEDLPERIDYVLLSHDHHDHVDHKTLKALKPRVGRVVCGLGIGAHLERWGYPPEMLLEGDWGDVFEPEPGITIALETARHFSGRALTWNRTLWASFVVEAGGRRIFYSGDGGYGSHFANLGTKWGGFDLAFIEDGQYDQGWRDIHLSPEETVRAAIDLNAKAAVPVHNSKYSISYHDWDDPLVRARKAARNLGVNLMTPLMGESVKVSGEDREFPPWWEGRD